MYNSKLWQTSGHWQNYQEDMFVLDIEKEKWALKPMNCPGHCLIFDARDRSYKELPIRMAEFGIIHRNEASGALTGLTRVRRFVQDDTHIFCMPSQVRRHLTNVDLASDTLLVRSRMRSASCLNSWRASTGFSVLSSTWSCLPDRTTTSETWKHGTSRRR